VDNFSKLAICSTLIFFSAIAISSASKRKNFSEEWRGQFEFEGYEGRSVGGSTIMSSVRIDLDTDGACHIVHVGFQVYEDIACEFKISEAAAMLKAFYKPSTTTASLPYKNGDILFILTKNMQRQVHVRWEAMQPHGNHGGQVDRFRKISTTPLDRANTDTP